MIYSKLLFAFLLFIHGLIHLMGFSKAFGYGNMANLTKNISRPVGVLWLLTVILSAVVLVKFLFSKEWWWVGMGLITLSQILIILSWKDAKIGTIANGIILVVAFLSFTSWQFERTYKADVTEGLQRTNSLKEELLIEADLQSLPEPVQRYLHYSGVINKPKVKNVRIVFEGEMRDKGKDWFPFTTEQYNFFDEPTRLFFMKGRMFGMIVPGYHRYNTARASMDIRLFGLFPIVKLSGEQMNKAETVTLFNDMCLMAPATLIDKRITWQPIDSTSARAVFTNHGISISAVLYINEQGQLVNFVSNDRTATSDMKQYPFSTPVGNYKNINGINVMTYGEVIWHYSDGMFTYGKFNLKSIEYNVKLLK